MEGGMARLPYVAREELPAGTDHIWEEIAQHRGSVGNVFRALLNSPEAGRRVAAVGEYIRYGSKLRPDWREWSILMAAGHLGVQYEYRAHRPIAEKVGVTPEMFAVIEEDKPVETLPREEQIIVRYNRALLREHAIPDDIFNDALELLGREQLVDLTVLLGYYTMLGYTLLAFQVETGDPYTQR
jgi:4-carboxymuconolactone decarboxylase